MNQETVEEIKSYRPSKKFWIGLMLFCIVGIILLWPTEEGKVSRALRENISSKLSTGISSVGFDVNWVEINGDRAEISYRLLGSNYKATAIKVDGKWIIR